MNLEINYLEIYYFAKFCSSKIEIKPLRKTNHGLNLQDMFWILSKDVYMLVTYVTSTM